MFAIFVCINVRVSGVLISGVTIPPLWDRRRRYRLRFDVETDPMDQAET